MMKSICIFFFLTLTLVHGQYPVSFAPTIGARSEIQSAPGFEIQKIAEGVYAAIRKEPPGLTVNANSVFIIGENEVVVVDTTLTPGSAKETLAALRQLTSKPVKYVINTHWHDDHIMGNQVYRDAFPGVEFIAHENTREYLTGTGLANRKQATSAQGYPGFISFLRSCLEKNKSISGEPLNEEQRATYLSDIAIAERYMAENPGVEIVLPTITLKDHLTLKQGGRTIEIRYLGRGHTSGDIVVYLPRESIVITGDLVVWPVPYVGNPQSHPGDWAITLEKLISLHANMIIPGHGPVLHDDSYVRLMARLFGSIKQQVEAAVARGETLEQTKKSVNLVQFQKLFAGESRMRNDIFGAYVMGPAVAAAFNDASTVGAALRGRPSVANEGRPRNRATRLRTMRAHGIRVLCDDGAATECRPYISIAKAFLPPGEAALSQRAAYVRHAQDKLNG